MHPGNFFFHICVPLIFGVNAAPLSDDDEAHSLMHISKIKPIKNEIHLNEDDLLELVCTGYKNVTFIYPKHNHIRTSLVEIRHHRHAENLYKTTLNRKKTVYGDTGWYGCIDTDKVISSLSEWINLNPDNVQHPIKWVYVYVKSKKQAFHNNVDKYTTFYSELGEDVLLPCRVNSPDYHVDFFHEDNKIDLKNKEKFIYNPRKGLIVKNVTTQDSGFYQCFNYVFYDMVNYMLHVTKKLADMYNPVVDKLEVDESSLGEQIKVNCSAEISYDVTYSFQWTTPRNNDRISINDYRIHRDMNTFVEVKELVIENAAIEDQGKYVCTVSTGKKTNSTEVNLKFEKARPYYSKKDLMDLKNLIVKEIKSSIEEVVVNAVEKSVGKNIENTLESIKSKLEQYF